MRRAVVNLLTAMSAFAFCAPVGIAAAQTPVNQTPISATQPGRLGRGVEVADRALQGGHAPGLESRRYAAANWV